MPRDIQSYILVLMEAECEARDLVLVVARDFANIGTACAMRGAYTVARFSFTFSGDEVTILFEGEKIGQTWKHRQDWQGVPGVENRHSFKLNESPWLAEMILRWRTLLAPKEDDLA